MILALQPQQQIVTDSSLGCLCEVNSNVLFQSEMPKILLVDDEPDGVELMAFNLRAAGFEVIMASNGEEALCKARSLSPSLIVLDVMLPEIDGFEVCRLLRRDPLTFTLPIIMLTALSSEISRFVGLETGADDYLTKPASPREVVSRVSRLLRSNPRKTPGTQFHVKDLFVDVPNQLVTVNGSRIELSRREFELLSFLAQTIFRRVEAASRISLARNSLDL